MSTLFTTSLLLTLQLLSFAQGRTLSSLAILNDTATSNLPIQIIPITPPGITFEPAGEADRPISEIGIYDVVIKLMYGLSTQNWGGPVDLSRLSYLATDDKKVRIYADAFSTQLQPRHLIVALYKVITDMYNDLPGYCRFAIKIFRDKRPIGEIEIVGNLRTTPDGNSILSTSLTPIKPLLINSTISAGRTSGMIVDPEDSKLLISWHANSEALPAEEVFGSVMDGIADVAAFDIRTSCQPITGTSLNGEVTFRVGGERGGAMLCGRISTVFYLIFGRVLVDARLWKDIDILVYYDGRVIGSGKIASTGRTNGNRAAKVEAS